jgi:hypothetical protein
MRGVFSIEDAGQATHILGHIFGHSESATRVGQILQTEFMATEKRNEAKKDPSIVGQPPDIEEKGDGDLWNINRDKVVMDGEKISESTKPAPESKSETQTPDQPETPLARFDAELVDTSPFISADDELEESIAS